MKIVHVETLFARGPFAESSEWVTLQKEIRHSVCTAEWPVGSASFTINPVRKGNGVIPIKDKCIDTLRTYGWKPEAPLNITSEYKPGNIDALYESPLGHVAFEWETGNVSSSHRAMNKMALGLLRGVLVSATLVVPSRKLYRYLTDRIGNIDELMPYCDVWRSIACENGVFQMVVIEHDAESLEAPLIPKGKDGNAKKPTK